MEQFTNLFPVHKTIKFKVYPIGETFKQMEDLLKDDKERAMAYQVVKCLINAYCQNEVIAPNLKKLSSEQSWTRKLEEFHNARDWDSRSRIQSDLIQIVNKKLPKSFNSKALLERLPCYIEKLSDEDLRRTLHNIHDYEITVNGQKIQDVWDGGLKDFALTCHGKFQKFSGYFKPLEVNLKFLFSGKRNGIAHRIVYQNLVTFERNRKWSQIVERIQSVDDITCDYSECLVQDGIDKYNESIGRLVMWLKEYGDSHSDYRNLHKHFKKLNKQILSPRVVPEWLQKAFNSDEEMILSLRAFLDEIEPQHLRLNQLVQNFDSYDNHIYIFRKALPQFSILLRDNYKALDEELDLPNGQTKCKSVSFAWMPFKKELVEELKKEVLDIFSKINKNSQSVTTYLDGERAKRNDYRQNNQASLCIKNLMESYLALYRTVKPLIGTGEEEDRNEDFYDELTTIWDILQHVKKLYDSVRNWLNTKIYENNSYPVFLNEYTLLKKKDSHAYIKRNGKYYFILYKDIKEKDIINHKGDSAIFYHVDKQDPNHFAANLERWFIFSMKANKAKGRNKPTKAKFVRDHSEFLDDWEIVKSGKYKNTRNKKARIHAISYFQRCLQVEYKEYNWQFRPAEEYESFDDFIDSHKDNLFKIEEYEIDWAHVLQLADEGKIYLFKLYNKDYAKNKVVGSKPNLHTLYWEMMFSRQNLVHYNITLEEPKIFRREKASTPQGVLDMRNIPRRFAKDHLELHIPLHMNVNAHVACDLNQAVLEAIRDGKINHIIGIDRGERNLLYYSVLRLSDGKIIKKGQHSLNITSNNVDYHAKLSEKEKELHDEEKDWKARTGIRKLKEGYLSQAINQLTSLIIKYHAVIVLEDLPDDFISKRQKINKQIYQIFEKKLVDKLSYLVDKDANEGQTGNIHSALQLAKQEFDKEEPNKIRQNGFLFLVPPDYTSAIDPVTGFCNLFDKDCVRNVCSLLSNFESISYDQQHDWFEFTWDYSCLINYTRLTQCDTSLRWTACSNGSRIEWTGSEKMQTRKCETVNLTDSFKTLFDKYNIQYQKGEDIREAICSIRDTDYKKELKRLFFLMLSLRNTVNDGEKQQDSIISPVRDGEGKFYDSREYEEKDDPELPTCGDANGAYNIARKGILTIQKLGSGNDEALSLNEWVNSTREGNIHLRL